MMRPLFETYVRRHQQTYWHLTCTDKFPTTLGFSCKRVTSVPPGVVNVCCLTVLWELKYRIVGREICKSLIKVFQLIVSGSSSCLTAAALFPPGAAQQKPRSNQSTLSLPFNASWLRRLTDEKRDGDEKNDSTGQLCVSNDRECRG